MKITHFIQDELGIDAQNFLQNSILQLTTTPAEEEQYDALYSELIGCYSNKLSYHNLSHIYTFLKIAYLLEDQIHQPTPFFWAIWYHDAIYHPKRKDNEKQSAERALKKLDPYLNTEDLNQTNSLILSTAKHVPLKPEDEDHRLFLDMDLSILASNKDTYRLYADAIAKEYSHVPRFLYRYGRKKVLKNFLRRPQIFYTPIFREWGESKARENIQHEIRGFK